MTKRGIKITRESFFRGVHKVGLDSGMLISLVDNKDLFSEYILKIDQEDGLLFTHEICVDEAIEVLSRDYQWNKEQASKAVYSFLQEYHIEVLPRDPTNAEMVKSMYRLCKEAKIDFHPPDCFIIADFHKQGMNKIYSNNNHFLEACQLFGMDNSKLKTEEKEIEKQLREIFRKRRT